MNVQPYIYLYYHVNTYLYLVIGASLYTTGGCSDSIMPVTVAEAAVPEDCHRCALGQTVVFSSVDEKAGASGR